MAGIESAIEQMQEQASTTAAQELAAFINIDSEEIIRASQEYIHLLNSLREKDARKETLKQAVNDIVLREDESIEDQINNALSTFNNTALAQAIFIATEKYKEKLIKFAGKEYTEKIVYNVGGELYITTDTIAASRLFSFSKAASSKASVQNEKTIRMSVRQSGKGIEKYDLGKDANNKKYLTLKKLAESVQNLKNEPGKNEIKVGKFHAIQIDSQKILLSYGKTTRLFSNKGDFNEVYNSAILRGDFRLGNFLNRAKVDNVSGRFLGDFQIGNISYSSKGNKATYSSHIQLEKYAHQLLLEDMSGLQEKIAQQIEAEQKLSSSGIKNRLKSKMIEQIKKELPKYIG